MKLTGALTNLICHILVYNTESNKSTESQLHDTIGHMRPKGEKQNSNCFFSQELILMGYEPNGSSLSFFLIRL